METRELMLAALAAGGQAASFSPVQVQKLFFLIDREISNHIDGARFNFRPYDYGPFDSGVYSQLEAMSRDGLVVITQGYYRSFSLTEAGYVTGNQQLPLLPAVARDFITRSAIWVRSVPFNQLVSAIYQKYPDMKAASVFRQK